MYRSIDPDKVVLSLEQLGRRIGERFPGAGLGNVCAELTDVAREYTARAEAIARPSWGVRLAVAAVLVGGVALLVAVTRTVRLLKTTTDDLVAVLQGIEASMNVLVLMGAAVLFLVTFEARLKRKRALGDLHQLRSIVHVIDMHQLTKDPTLLTAADGPTASSPPRRFSPFELVRYLDYCSEMLSLTGKVAALYAQHSRDEVIIATVNELEQLTTNLSEKIWQKITIVGQAEKALAATVGPAAAAAGGDRERR